MNEDDLVENDVFMSVVTWLLQYGLVIIGAAITLAGVLAWSGRWRSWARQKTYGMLTRVPTRYTLGLAFLGPGIIFISLGIFADLGIIPGSDDVYDVIGAALIFVSLIGVFWWPAALTPRWYRDWLTWGGPQETDPWPTDKERAEGRR
ncbi:hypothetical protein [Microbacterium sp. A93]|uniref:hypothetical protein n=1 Tax=Microbacterium sp. A93 TaxID=3450716 RepID=UPI003F42C6F5